MEARKTNPDSTISPTSKTGLFAATASSSPFKKPLCISAADNHHLNLVALTEIKGNRILAATDQGAVVIYNRDLDQVEYTNKGHASSIRTNKFAFDNRSLDRHKRYIQNNRVRHVFPVLDKHMCHISDVTFDVYSIPEHYAHSNISPPINSVDTAFSITKNRAFLLSREEKTCLIRNVDNLSIEWRFTGLPVASSTLQYIGDRLSKTNDDFIIDAVQLGNGDIACLSAMNDVYVVDQATGHYKSRMKVHDNNHLSVKILCTVDKHNLVLCNHGGSIIICDTHNNTISTHRLLDNCIYSANVFGNMLLTLSEDGALNIWDSSFNLLKSVQSIGSFTNFISLCSNGDLLIPQLQDKSNCVIHRLPLDYILKHPSNSIEFDAIPKLQNESVSAKQLSPGR